MAASERKRILCLDGGEFEGQLSIDLLKEAMAQVLRQYDNPPEQNPWEYFDLICGTGTGGLIAIMLGRLQWDIDTVVERYIKIQEAIAASLCDMDLKKTISELMPDDFLSAGPKADCTSRFCRTLVLSVRPDGFQKSPVRMRSYNTEDYDAFDAKISDVAYAILAIDKILPPLNINGVLYAEASKWNNPTLEAINEANYVWSTPRIDLISIGTGIKDTEPLSKQAFSFTQVLFGKPKTEPSNSNLSDWAIQLSRTSEGIHVEAISKWEMYAKEESKYIRLNACQEAPVVGLKEWGKKYKESCEMRKQIGDKL